MKNLFTVENIPAIAFYVLVALNLICFYFAASFQSVKESHLMIELARRSDGQPIAYIIPYLATIEKRRAFGKAKHTYVVSYDGISQQNISAEEYQSLLSSSQDEDKWQPISEQEAQRLLSRYWHSR